MLFTILYVASQEGHGSVVDALLQWGAHANSAMNDGATAYVVPP